MGNADQLKMIILVDLDNTLTDRMKTHEKEIETAEKYGIEMEVYEKCVRELIRRHGNHYSFDKLMPILLETIADLPASMLQELEALLDEKVFFDDSLAFLYNFHPSQLIIISSGDFETQNRKIRAHGLKDLTYGFVVTDKKATTVEILAKIVGEEISVYFIDDTPRQLDVVKRQNPNVTCIQVREPLPWEWQKECECEDIIKLPTLTEAFELIQGRLKI